MATTTELADVLGAIADAWANAGEIRGYRDDWRESIGQLAGDLNEARGLPRIATVDADTVADPARMGYVALANANLIGGLIGQLCDLAFCANCEGYVIPGDGIGRITNAIDDALRPPASADSVGG